MLKWIFPSLGMLGIVTRVLIRIVPRYVLKATTTAVPLKELCHTLVDTLKSNEYSRIIYYPVNRIALVWLCNPVESMVRCNGGFWAMMRTARRMGLLRSLLDELKTAEGFRQREIAFNKRTGPPRATTVPYCCLAEQEHLAAIMETKLKLRKNLPVWAHQCAAQLWERPLIEGVIDRTAQRLASYRGYGPHVLLLSRNDEMPHADMELMFRLDQAPLVLREIDEIFSSDVWFPYTQLECRLILADDHNLSQFRGQDTFAIDFQAFHAEAPEYFGMLERRLSKFQYRMHWAKGVVVANGEYMKRRFPAGTWRALLNMARKHDPTGKFMNEHTERWFASGTSG